ncbi:MAG: hypothetical protein M3370_11115 [Actinomycetota bacterium]|nr:hypothetical protein [Actinomycetota bacterium]
MENLPDHIEPPAADHDDEDALGLPLLIDAGSDVTAADDQAGYPVIEWHQGQPVPNLDEIEQDRWREVLTPLTQPVRNAAARRVGGSLEASRQAGVLAVTLDLEDGAREQEARQRAARPHTLPAPAASDAPESASRQVNFRISPGQHERLAQAAQRIGAKPGQLARILTMRGVEHMLWEERSRG